MGVYTQTDGNWVSRRGSFLILLIAFHILLLWALKSGFAVKLVESITAPIKAEIINEPEIEEPPPPPPPVKAVEMPPVSVPPVLVDIQIPIETPPIQITTAPPPPGPPAPPVFGPPAPPAPPAPPSVTTKVAYAFKPDPADFYPSTSIQLAEEGKGKVQLCFTTAGKVETASITESTGKKRLDDAAVKMGKQVRIKPPTVDGKAQADCVVMPVTFSLKDLK
jgi:protein TonB